MRRSSRCVSQAGKVGCVKEENGDWCVRLIKSGPPSAVETRQLYLHLPFPTVEREREKKKKGYLNVYHVTFDKFVVCMGKMAPLPPKQNLAFGFDDRSVHRRACTTSNAITCKLCLPASVQSVTGLRTRKLKLNSLCSDSLRPLHAPHVSMSSTVHKDLVFIWFQPTDTPTKHTAHCGVISCIFNLLTVGRCRELTVVLYL